MRHPIQPVETDAHGTLRFKGNAIVRHLLDFASSRGCSLNEIAAMDFTRDDHVQFAQLIGYSVSGFGDLSYVDNETYDAAERMAEGADERDARIVVMQSDLDMLRAALREPMARLFGVHPSDLGGEE